MKNLAFSIVVFILFILPMQAQEALYIYRNDGHFNAFFYDEIDSMIYSPIDVDSVVHETCVTQEIYTNDSIYRIPLSAIDSIGFATPEVVYQSSVKRAEDLMDAYLQKVEGLKLTFDSSIPTAQRPQKGDILLYLEGDTPFFEEGFVGKVAKTSLEGQSLIVDCVPIDDLTEIFSRFVAVEEIGAPSTDQGAARRAKGKFDHTLFSKELNLTKNFINTANCTAGLTGHLTAELSLKAVYNITMEDVFLEMSLIKKISGGIGVGVEGQASVELTYPLLSIPPVYFPSAIPVFKCQFTPSLFFRADLSASFNVSGEVSKSTVYTWTYKNGKFGGQTVTEESGKAPSCEWSSNFSMEGSLQAGVLFDFYVGTIDAFGLAYMGTSLDIYAGPKLSGSIDVDLKQATSGDWYETLKDCKVEFTPLALDFVATGKAKYLGEDVKEHTFFETSLKFQNKEYYLFPEFSDLDVTRNLKAHSATLKSNVTRSIVPIPTYSLRLGYGLYDEDGELLQTVYDERPYQFNHTYDKLQQTLSSIKLGTYTASPIIAVAGYDIDDISTSQDVDVVFAVTPFTDAADELKINAVTLHGHFDGDVEYLQGECQTGFIYSKKEQGLQQGTVVYANPTSNGRLQAGLSELSGGTTYYYQTFLCDEGEYIYGEVQSFKTPFPVEITNVKMTDATYYPDHYTYKGKKYSFKYNCSTSVKLTDGTDVEDWGYVYLDPDGSETMISLAEFGRNSITDPRYAYCRNEAASTLRLKAYVKLKGRGAIDDGEVQEFPLDYPQEASLQMTGCEYVGTTTGVTYMDEKYQYKSTFRLSFDATGAYWLSVEADEMNDEGSGWKNWKNELSGEAMRPVDGANVLVVNYYYNDKELEGTYKVCLKGVDGTHSQIYRSSEYATYTYGDTHFTGCTFHSAADAQRRMPAQTEEKAEHEPYEIVCNKIHY